MKAILMAAGVGSRLKGAFDKPKCLLDVGGMPLLRRTITMLKKNGVKPAVVVGYRKEEVIEALDGLDVTFFYNPFYKVTNSMGSLWFARSFFEPGEDMIFGNADVFWGQDIFDLLTADNRDAVMLSDASRVDEGDYFFRTENGRIVAYGKELTRDERDCEYVGLAKLRKDFLKGFGERMEMCVEDELYNQWWENVLYNYSMTYPVYALDVDGRFWGEIDYKEDYERILRHLESEVSE